MRVVIAAFALCALSFAAGIVGDLSMASPPEPLHGATVVVQLPPDAIRAHPLAPLATAAAAAAELAPASRPRRIHALIPREKPHAAPANSEPKENSDRAPKGERRARPSKGQPA